jgi:hypothetical protein
LGTSSRADQENFPSLRKLPQKNETVILWTKQIL